MDHKTKVIISSVLGILVLITYLFYLNENNQQKRLIIEQAEYRSQNNRPVSNQIKQTNSSFEVETESSRQTSRVAVDKPESAFQLEPGQRALSIPVSSLGGLTLVSPGFSIDIIVEQQDRQMKKQFENIQILAVDRISTAGWGPGIAQQSITLAFEQQQAEEILKLIRQQNFKLWFLIRPIETITKGEIVKNTEIEESEENKTSGEVLL